MTSSLDPDARALRDVVSLLEPPALARDTFARITMRRANGERVALSTDALPRVEIRRWIIVAAGASAVAALVMLALLPTLWRDAPVTTPAPASPIVLAAVDSACAVVPVTSRDSSMLRHLMISAFGVPAACGAEPGQDPPIAYDASQIASGRFTYGHLSLTDGVYTSMGHSAAITISRTIYEGAPAILAVRDGPPQTGVHLDSLIVSANGPAPLYWASIYKTQHPGGAIHARFDRDTISIVMTGHLDTAAKLPFRMKSGQLPFGFALPLVIPALPLAKGWHGVIEIAPPIHPRAFKYFLRPWESMSLRVVGRERIRVAAGNFDCWKVQIGDSGDEAVMWVSTTNHLVIRSISVSHFGDTSFDDRSELERAAFSPN
jgi:hypothetical protein